MLGWRRSFTALISLGVFISACGGSSTGGSGATNAQIAAAVARAQAAATASLASTSQWGGPTTGPTPIAGKRVAIISCLQQTEGCNRPSRAALEAAKVIGWQPSILDGQGEPSKQLAALNAAVDAHYDAIILILISPGNVGEGLTRAMNAHIPVVTLGAPDYTKTGAQKQIPDISHDWTATGTLIGDYMIWKSGGRVHALLLDDNSTPVVQFGQFKGTFEELSNKTNCPDCTLTVKTFTQATLTTLPQQYATAAVQADPSIKWVWCYDFCMQEVATTLIAAGLQGSIQGAGFDCNAQNLQLMRDHKVQVVCVADPRDWEAWATVDQANRLMQGQAAADQHIPFHLVDLSNVDALSPTDLTDGWQGGIDYKAQFKKLWGK
jgi:ribose transport system substrate-binding protein